MRTLVGVTILVVFLALACGPAQSPAGTLAPAATSPAGADVPQPPLIKPDTAIPAPGSTAGQEPAPGMGGPGAGLAVVAAYQGNVRFNGQAAPSDFVGAAVEAVVDDQVCSSGAILAPIQEGGVKVTPYSALRVEFGRDLQDKPVCGRPGAVVQFLIGGSRLAAERAEWKLGLNQVDLNWPGSTGATGGVKPTFQGKAALLGSPAGDGLVVRAYVGSNLCGMATTKGGNFALFLHSQESSPQCAKSGDEVRFTIGGRDARQTAVFQQVSQGTVLDLTSQ
jgi:hypothetical protein